MSLGNGDANPIKSLQRADELFMAGRFEDARPLFEELAGYEQTAVHAHLQLGRIALLGDEQDLCELHLAIAYNSGEPAALAPLCELYRRRGRYAEAAACFDTLGRWGMAKTLAAFEGRQPFEQHGNEEVSMPLVCTDPLPIVRLAVNGHPADFLVDTGAEQSVLDTDLARKAEVEMGASETGVFSGGRRGQLRHAILGALDLGGHTLGNIPIHIQPLRQTFSGFLSKQRVDGICGCDVLYRFEAELDLKAGNLSLRPWERPSPEQGGANIVPLWLAGAHLPIVRIAIDQRFETPALIDTGQSGMLFAASAATTRSVGAKPSGPLAAGQGGGGDVPLIPIALTTLSLGSTLRWCPRAACMPYFPLEYRFGFRIGGLLSYDFFQAQGVVFDFARMRLQLTAAE